MAMGDLILNNLEIRNFKVFEHLCIEKLGRVNLIAGKNNVGKTCLLEALYLYATGAPWAIRELLEARDQAPVAEPGGSTSSKHSVLSSRSGDEAILTSVAQLFHGRSFEEPDNVISI